MPGKDAVADEAGRGGVPDEERRDHQVDLVDEPCGEEPGVDRTPALDHQPVYAARGKVRQDDVQVDRVTGVHDGCHPGEPLASPVRRGARGIDDLLDLPGGEEAGAAVEVAKAGEGDLDGAFRQAAGHPLLAAGRRADQQPGVVATDGVGAHQDGVDTGPDLVDPVEVGVVGQQQPPVAGIVDVAVHGHGHRQQDVRPLGHAQYSRLVLARQVTELTHAGPG